MSARALWKAQLCLGPIKVPVRLYSAVEDRTVHFRMLHAADQAPVKQQMVKAAQGDAVPPEAVQRGLAIEEGTYVLLRREELEDLEPPPSRDIHVEELVSPDRVHPRWLSRPYYLGPDGDEESYFALVRALERRRRLGIARWVMRKNRYQGALQARGGYLVLQTMRHAGELVALERIRPPADREPDERELAMAEQLVLALADTFQPAAYHDDYRERVLKLVAAKARGQQIELPAEQASQPAPPSSLSETLQASLRAAREAGHG